MIDSEYLEKGKPYYEMPEVHIIYISETDLWKAGKTTYRVKKYFDGTDIPYACIIIGILQPARYKGKK